MRRQCKGAARTHRGEACTSTSPARAARRSTRSARPPCPSACRCAAPCPASSCKLFPTDTHLFPLDPTGADGIFFWWQMGIITTQTWQLEMALYLEGSLECPSIYSDIPTCHHQYQVGPSFILRFVCTDEICSVVLVCVVVRKNGTENIYFQTYNICIDSIALKLFFTFLRY